MCPDRSTTTAGPRHCSSASAAYAEGFPAGGGVVETALLLDSEDVDDVWTKDQVPDHAS